MAPQHDHRTVSEQITATRETVGELIELMTRTRAPLTEPSPAPPVPSTGRHEATDAH
jgi:hypothetical protein